MAVSMREVCLQDVHLSDSSLRALQWRLLVVLARQLCTPWDRPALVGTMANRHHSTSRSPPNATRRDACRLLPDSRQPPGSSLLAPFDQVLRSPFARLDAPTHRGDPPMPAPAPVSGPSPTIHLANADPFARARIAAVQSRVAAPAVSDPRPPPPVPASSPFRDGHYWCSKSPFLDSCSTSCISTQALLWTSLPAPCSPRSNGSRAQLPLAVASGVWVLGFATVVVRPVRPGLPRSATSLWGLLVHLQAVRTRPWLTSMSQLRPA